MLKLSNFKNSLLSVAILSLMLMAPLVANAKNVVIATPLGNIEIELLEDAAPKTVANFLRYVETDRYNFSFIHRSAHNPDGSAFILQGGGYKFVAGSQFNIPEYPAVENEFNVSNTRGTIAMAKLGGNPDSATSEWFINLADNSSNLDNQNGGFTVFARVVGNGMAVADAISQLATVNAGGPYTDLPVFDPGAGWAEDNLIMTDVSVVVEEPSFVMNAGLNDAWFDPVTDGQGFFITVFPDKGTVLLAWFTYDTELPAEDAPSNLGDAGHRWLTALGTINGNTSVLNVDSTSGGLFDDPAVITHTPDGTMTLTFESCTSGVVEYNLPSIGQTGTVPIQRVAGDNIPLCEALAAAEETLPPAQ